MKDGTVADVLEREENVVAGVTVVEEGETWVFTVRDALIIGVTECATLDEAIEAARALNAGA